MWAVVRPVSPPPIWPSSMTTTARPARASMYAVDIPAMPAPTMQTLVRMSWLTRGREGSSVVTIQTEVVRPESLRISFLIFGRIQRIFGGHVAHRVGQFYSPLDRERHPDTPVHQQEHHRYSRHRSGPRGFPDRR